MKSFVVSSYGFALGALVVFLACLGAGKCGDGPSPVVDAAPPPVAKTPCEAACSNLASLKCPEGLDSSCVAICQRVQDGRLTNFKPDELAAARTVAEVRAVGTVECLTASSAKKAR